MPVRQFATFGLFHLRWGVEIILVEGKHLHVVSGGERTPTGRTDDGKCRTTHGRTARLRYWRGKNLWHRQEDGQAERKLAGNLGNGSGLFS